MKLSDIPQALLNALTIESNEVKPLRIMMLMGVLIGGARNHVYLASYSLFLEQYTSNDLPLVYVAIAVIVATVSTLYLKLAEKIDFSVLIVGNLLTTSIVTGLMWIGVGSHSGRVVFLVLPIWCETLNVLTYLAYWNLAGRVFNVRQGKRLFGILGAGDRIAEIIVGFLAPVVVLTLGTRALFLFSCTALLFASLLAMALVKFGIAKSATEDNHKLDSKQPASLRETVRHRYVSVLIIHVLLTWFTFTAIDLIFYNRVEAKFVDADKIATLLGFFNSALGAVGLLGQIILSSKILKRIGVNGGIMATPLTLLACMYVVTMSQSFIEIGLLLSVFIGVTRFSADALIGIIDSPSILLFYQPIQVDQRTRIQGFIDGVVYPVSIGLAGIALYALTNVFEFGMLAMSWTILISIGLWSITALLLNAEYPGMVKSALNRRLLDNSDIEQLDDVPLLVLRNSLKLRNIRQAIFVIKKLSLSAPEDLAIEINSLLRHEDEQIVLAALAEIEKHRFLGALKDVQQALESARNAQLQCSALQTLCAIDDSGLNIAELWLDSHDDNQKRAAIVSIFHYGNLHQLMKASAYLLALEASGQWKDKLLLAELIERSGVRGFYQHLLALLESDDLRIWRSAARAASSIKHNRLIPPLLANLTVPGKRVTSENALITFGNQLLPDLRRILANRRQYDHAMIAQVVNLMGRIGNESAVSLIRPFLEDRHELVRASAVKALTSYANFSAEFDESWFIDAMSSLGRRAIRVSLVMACFEPVHEASLLCQCLVDELETVRDNLFDLLGLTNQRDTIHECRVGVKYGNETEQAYALECLELILPPAIRQIALPILDATHPPARRAVTLSNADNKGFLLFEKCLYDMIQSDTNWHKKLIYDIIQSDDKWPFIWTRLSALDLIVKQGANHIEPLLLATANDAEPTMRLHACLLAQRLGVAMPTSPEIERQLAAHKDERMLPIEKLAALRGADIFADKPVHALAELAQIAKEQVAPASATVIQGNAIEDYLYFIVKGQVDILVGDKVINRIGKGTIIDAIRPADPAYGLTSALAINEVGLLKIERELYDEIITESHKK
jgi:HEAT repeat protein